MHELLGSQESQLVGVAISKRLNHAASQLGYQNTLRLAFSG